MWLYLIGALLANGAVVAIVPESWKPYVAAIGAAITTILAFKDPSTGLDKAEANMRTMGSIRP